MKRLLLLGGSRYLIPVIRAAHALGHEAITCDYLPDNPAHSYSDAYYDVSILDREGVVRVAQEVRADGIMSFATDPGVVTAAYACERLGLPTCPLASVEVLQDKDRFRRFLQENGFAAPRSAGCGSVEEAVRKSGGLRWPLIVKPVDSAGSKGVARVDEPAQLAGAVQNALRYSHCGRLILEEFIEKLGDSSDSDCFSVDGRLAFVSFSDQRFDPAAQNPYTPAAYTWPSRMPACHQQTLTEELQRLLTLLGMGTSLYNVETRVGIDGTPYIMEVAPRGGGNRLAEIVSAATGVDLIQAAVKAAVGDPLPDVRQRPFQDYWGEYVLHAQTPGRFRALRIAPELEPFVHEVDLWVREGDPVRAFTGANESVGTLVFRFDTRQQQESYLGDTARIQRLVRVVAE